MKKNSNAVEILLKNPEICILLLPFNKFTMFHVVLGIKPT